MKATYAESGVRTVLALALLIVSAFWCYSRDAEGNLPCVVNEPEDIREQLWMTQGEVLPSSDFPVFVRVGDFLCFGMDDSESGLVAGLLPIEGDDGVLRWPVTIYEDPVSHDTVFLNACGEEIFRLQPPEGYDPLWVLASIYPEGYPEGLDLSAYNPSRVVVSANLIAPDSLLLPFSERAAQSFSADAKEVRSLTEEDVPSGRIVARTAGMQGEGGGEESSESTGDRVSVTAGLSQTADSRSDRVFVDSRTGDDGYSGHVPVTRAVDGESAAEGPKKTLRAGLNAVRDGGRIVVSGGFFAEDLDVRGRNVNVSIDGVVALGN